VAFPRRASSGLAPLTFLTLPAMRPRRPRALPVDLRRRSTSPRPGRFLPITFNVRPPSFSTFWDLRRRTTRSRASAGGRAEGRPCSFLASAAAGRRLRELPERPHRRTGIRPEAFRSSRASSPRRRSRPQLAAFGDHKALGLRRFVRRPPTRRSVGAPALLARPRHSFADPRPRENEAREARLRRPVRVGRQPRRLRGPLRSPRCSSPPAGLDGVPARESHRAVRARRGAAAGDARVPWPPDAPVRRGGADCPPASRAPGSSRDRAVPPAPGLDAARCSSSTAASETVLAGARRLVVRPSAPATWGLPRRDQRPPARHPPPVCA